MNLAIILCMLTVIWIIHMQLSCKDLELESLIEYFYATKQVPSKAVKMKKLKHRRVFIQSTSQGSRCLKKGAKLLYLKEVHIYCCLNCIFITLNHDIISISAVKISNSKLILIQRTLYHLKSLHSLKYVNVNYS